jgi:hypothetical protein
MAKKVIGQIKLHLPGGQATPAPPVGPALGQHGLNIMDFCKAGRNHGLCGPYLHLHHQNPSCIVPVAAGLRYRQGIG